MGCEGRMSESLGGKKHSLSSESFPSGPYTSTLSRPVRRGKVLVTHSFYTPASLHISFGMLASLRTLCAHSHLAFHIVFLNTKKAMQCVGPLVNQARVLLRSKVFLFVASMASLKALMHPTKAASPSGAEASSSSSSQMQS